MSTYAVLSTNRFQSATNTLRSDAPSNWYHHGPSYTALKMCPFCQPIMVSVNKNQNELPDVNYGCSLERPGPGYYASNKRLALVQ